MSSSSDIPSSPANAGAVLGFNSDGTTDNNVVTLGVHYSSVFYDIIKGRI